MQVCSCVGVYVFWVYILTHLSLFRHGRLFVSFSPCVQRIPSRRILAPLWVASSPAWRVHPRHHSLGIFYISYLMVYYTLYLMVHILYLIFYIIFYILWYILYILLRVCFQSRLTPWIGLTLKHTCVAWGPRGYHVAWL